METFPSILILAEQHGIPDTIINIFHDFPLILKYSYQTWKPGYIVKIRNMFIYQTGNAIEKGDGGIIDYSLRPFFEKKQAKALSFPYWIKEIKCCSN